MVNFLDSFKNLNLTKIFSDGSKEKNFLVLDIGSDFVKVIIFELTSEGRAAALGIGKYPLKLSDTRSGVIADIPSVTEAVDLAINEARLTCDVEVKDTIACVSGLLTKGSSTTVRLSRSDSEKQITEKELNQISAKIEDAAYLEVTKEMARISGNPDLEIELTNSAITNVKIDGYYITNPVGFRGKQMEVTLFTAFSPGSHLSVIQSICKDLGLKLMTISSSMYALTNALSFLEPTEFNALIFDLGGETTDIALVFGGGIVSTRTINIGGRHFTRKIAEKLGVSFNEAEQRKLSYVNNELEGGEGEEADRYVKEVTDLWESSIEVALSDFEGIKSFPSKIYLTGGGSALPKIKKILQERRWGKNLPFKSVPTCDMVSLFDLSKIEDRTGKLDVPDLIMPASVGMVGLEIF